MIKNKTYFFVGMFLLVSIYLLATAPPPLATMEKHSSVIPIKKALQIVDSEHRRIRFLYTKEIVGAGSKRGLKFDENWMEKEVIAGPLPAQFLREIARSLEQNPVPLGLFLASDYAINDANRLEGEQLAQFKKMKNNKHPVYDFANDIQRFTYMVPDIAVAKPCVDCHNDHKDSPKTNWKKGDIMGATTWIYPDETLSYEELFAMLQAFQHGVEEAYGNLLDEFMQLSNPPLIGKKWPTETYAIPDLETFMEKVNEINSASTLKTIASLSEKESFPIIASNE